MTDCTLQEGMLIPTYYKTKSQEGGREGTSLSNICTDDVALDNQWDLLGNQASDACL